MIGFLELGADLIGVSGDYIVGNKMSLFPCTFANLFNYNLQLSKELVLPHTVLFPSCVCSLPAPLVRT